MEDVVWSSPPHLSPLEKTQDCDEFNVDISSNHHRFRLPLSELPKNERSNENSERVRTSCRLRLLDLIEKSKIEYSSSSSYTSSDLFSVDECRQILLSCLSGLVRDVEDFRDLSILEEACRLMNVLPDDSTSSSSYISFDVETTDSLRLHLNESLIVLLDHYVSLKESMKDRKNVCSDCIISELF